MILDKIVEATKVRVKQAKKRDNPFVFEKALRTNDIAFICEVKKASPSKGIIAEDFPYVEIAKEYEAAGAAAISVLTEPDFFMGSSEYLREIRQNVSIPILRKDFIIDEYQIYEASVIGADAVLLICAILDRDTLAKYIGVAHSIGLSALVETHSEAEVGMALSAGARIIGVNNRNLRTFEVDMTLSERLRKLVPEDILFVSESGISSPADVDKLRKAGANAALVGEALMKGVKLEWLK